MAALVAQIILPLRLKTEILTSASPKYVLLCIRLKADAGPPTCPHQSYLELLSHNVWKLRQCIKTKTYQNSEYAFCIHAS